MIRRIKNVLRAFRGILMYRLSSFIVCISGIKKKSDGVLRDLEGKYEGKRCFVIGNGPSLTADDLELLKDEITFASNRIYKMFSETDWRPSYYAVFDESVGADETLPININKENRIIKFCREQGWYIYRKIKGVIYLHSWHGVKYLDSPQFSTDLTKGIYTIATVTYALIQLARYMGFSEIYLVGVDHKYATEKNKDGMIIKNEGVKSYFGKEISSETKSVGAVWEMDIAYKYAEAYARKNGFRIFNATRGGFLEVFERVNLDDILK